MSFKTRAELQGDGPITIERDAHGIPHVLAASDDDLYRGLGYCHGADRGLQMLVLRVLVQGRGCELLADSDEMLGIDRFFRRMNFGREAAAERDKLPAGAMLDGPLIVEEATSTTLVHPDQHLRVDDFGFLHLTSA